MNDFQRWIESLLGNAGVSESALPYVQLAVTLLLFFAFAYLSLIIARRSILKFLHPFFKRTAVQWDDILIEYKTLDKLAHIVPAIIFKMLAPFVFAEFDEFLPFILKITDMYIIIIIVMIFVSLLKSLELGLSSSIAFKDKPLPSYFQMIRILIYAAASVLLLSVLLERSPIYFLTAFGAMTAIIVLIFKDTILGLVASVQISANDLVRVGDWVEMPKYNADGIVIAMNLNTIKVRNFDNTITAIPAFYFITDSFKNWRGMEESGGRRIMRSLYINVRSIKFVDEDLKAHISKFNLIKDFIGERQRDIEEHNAEQNINMSELINGRRMTNIGVFRHYIEAYLRSNPQIRNDMPLVVRQLQPEHQGLPIQIYCFTMQTEWLEYEAIQSDVFDHLLATITSFDLEIFQPPSGSDIVLAGEKLSAILKG
ncbi:MAG: mechanosensitive ion channel domain-containing protein [Bacteroidota bacterium]